MKATKKRCIELIRLCAGLDFFPADQAIRELLANTLQRCAIHDQHAVRIIERWLETERRAPTVSDIVTLAGQVNPIPATPFRQPNRSCPECLGFGFKIVEGSHGLTGAVRCVNECPIPTGAGEGASATPFPYAQERRQLTPYNRKFTDVHAAAVQEARR
jgi:hypothetical protein